MSNNLSPHLSPKAAGVKTVIHAANDRFVVVAEKGSAERADRNNRDGFSVTVTHLNNDIALKTQQSSKNPKKMQVITPDHVIPDGIYNASKAEFDLPVDGTKAGTDPLQLGRAIVSKYLVNCPDTLRGSLAVQIAYNIADIDKLLEPHLNSVICALNRIKGEETGDFFGNFYLPHDYNSFLESQDSRDEKKKEQLDWFAKNSRMNSFGIEFAEQYGEAKKKKVYYIMWLLSYIRHMTVHHNTDGGFLYLLESTALENDNNDAKSREHKKWNEYIDHNRRNGNDENKERAILRSARNEAVRYLDSIYTRKLDSFNRGFLKNAAPNISILENVLNIRDDDTAYIELLRQYYRFCETKEFRNEGYSVRLIREQILETYHDTIVQQLGNENKLISERQKINTLIDMLIYRYYLTHKNDKLKLIDSLRALSIRKGKACEGSWRDEQRQGIYRTAAERIWKWKATPDARFTAVYSAMYKLKNPQNFRNASLHQCAEAAFKNIKDSAASFRFCELLYLLCLFLDGKEINTMLTQMISKFDSIADFLDIARELEEKELLADDQKIIFRDEYEFFVRSREVSTELRKINSFARMTGKKGKLDGVNAKRSAYISAAELLGWDGDRESLLEYLDEKLLDPENTVKYRDLLRLNGQMSSSEEDQLSVHPDKHSSGFRNFICANVIDNARFRYLIRCGNPDELKALGHNRNLMRFVLQQLPPTQLERYAKLCKTNTGNQDQILETLTSVICEMSFKSFADVETAREARQNLEQKKTMISLYLTMLYLLVKNVINVNYRYVIAFNQLDRDLSLKSDIQGSSDNLKRLTDYYLLQEEIEYGVSTQRFRGYLRNDKDSFSKDQIKEFRNYVEHLDIISSLCKYAPDINNPTSYFAIYHYCIQMDLFSENRQFDSSNFKKKYLDHLKHKRNYSKNALKRICYPFGYNIPRYKNLSIEELFDEHNPIPDKKKGRLFPEENVPDRLYHMTSKTDMLDKIHADGLHVKKTNGTDDQSPYTRYVGPNDEKMAFIHLRSSENANRQKNGKKPIVLTVMAGKMKENGFEFFREEDGSWLVCSVPAEYIVFPDNL